MMDRARAGQDPYADQTMPYEVSGSAATPLDEWREQERERERTRYPFAAPEAERCEAVRRAAGNPFDKSDWTILYRCGKRKGHEGRHDCADEGWSMKWATL